MEILIINGHDYSKHIQRGGYGWSREDLDSENTIRTKDGRLRRDKIGTKRKLSYTTMDTMSREQLAQLDNDLSNPTFIATYLDLHGKQTRLFYCSSFSTKMVEVQDSKHEMWEKASFNMIEV